MARSIRRRCSRVVALAGDLERAGVTLTSDLVLSGNDESGLVGEHDRLHAVAQAELGQDARDVRLDRVLGEDQLGCDLGVGEPARDKAKDLDLALCELGEHGRLAATAIVGAALGPADRFPRGARCVALAALLAAAPAGTTVGTAVVVAGHTFSAGRREDRWPGIAWLLALLGAIELAVALSDATSDGLVPATILVLAGWAGGCALREREVVAARLAARVRELDEEHEAHAELSVRYERARIAAELHDIVGHAISVMVVQAAAGQRLAALDPALAGETFATIAGAARQAEADIGRLVALLGDEDAIGTAPDLSLVEDLVARAADTGLDVTLRLEGEPEGLPAATSEMAYRVVQEGVTNALRHAAGAAIRVTVRAERDAVSVEVVNAAASAQSGLTDAGTGTGLRGLRERAGAHGGRVAAGPTPDGGWRLLAVLPRRADVPARAHPTTRTASTER
jgi:signal transduction histidine kinase